MNKNNFRKLLFIISIGCMHVCLSGCLNENYSIALEGNWKVTEMAIDMPMLSQKAITGGQNLALSTNYFFRSDNTCLITSNNYPDGFENDWSLNQDSMLLHVKSKEEIIDEDYAYSIEFLTSKKITLYREVEDLGCFKMTLIKRGL